MADNRWVSFEEVKWGDRFVSTSQLRVVTVGGNNNPVRVVPIDGEGEYNTIPSSRKRMGQCDRIARVDMTPKQIPVPLKGTVSTKDGIALIGVIRAQAMVDDSEASIKRIVVNAQTEESLLVNSILAALREGILAHTWREVKTVKGVFLKDAKERLTAILTRTQSCFTVDDLIIGEEIQPENKEIALWLEKQEADELSRVTEKAQLAHTLETQGTRNEFELKQERSRMELGFEKAQQQIELELRNEEAKLVVLKGRADLMATEAGQMAMFPKEIFGLKTKEIEFKMAQLQREARIYSEVFKVVSSNQSSFMAGQISGIQAVLERELNIRLPGSQTMTIESKTKSGDDGANKTETETEAETETQAPNEQEAESPEKDQEGGK